MHQLGAAGEHAPASPTVARVLRGCAGVLLCWLIIACWTPAVHAVERYQVDEEVEVFYLNKWITARVRDCNKKGEVLGEFTFLNQPRHEIFPPEKVRHLYESGALARGRTWTDTTGKFKVKAALLKISGGKVELRTDQNKEVTIAIDKLSTSDQSFVKRFQQQAGVAALPVPEVIPAVSFDTTRSTPQKSTGRGWNSRRDAETEKTQLALAADPVRKGLELNQAGVGFPNVSAGERVRSLISLGGADNWVLAAVVPDESAATRLLWVALNKQAVKRIQMLPPKEVVVDYHPLSRQLLTFSYRRPGSETFGRGDAVLTVWKTDPAAEECQPVIAWTASLPSDKDPGSDVPWARFTSGTQVLQMTNNHRLLAWDFAEKRLSWDTAQESFFAPAPVMSAGGKYVLLPEDGGLRIIDSASGNVLGQVPLDRCTGVGVHPDGKRLAVTGDNRVYVVDITGEQPVRKYNASSIVSPFRNTVFWISDSLLCFDQDHGGMVLFSTELELPIWQYNFDHSAYFPMRGARTHSIVDSHLVYSATFRNAGTQGLAVGAVELPGDKAKQAIASARREDFLAIKPGSRFRLEVLALDHSAEIRTALENEITKNGWVYDESSPNVIRAEYKRGETQQVQYEMRSMRSMERNIQSATVTPYVASVQVMFGSDNAWSSMSSSGPPPMVMMREGESLQDYVNSHSGGEVWSFFQRVDIPSEIIHPKKRNGVGRTSVTTRGLVEEVVAE